MSASLSMILTFYITQFYLLKTKIYYRCILKTLFWELARLTLPLMLPVKFRIFQDNHSIKHLGSPTSVLSLLLSKLIFLTSMVERWKVRQIKNVSICFTSPVKILLLLLKYFLVEQSGGLRSKLIYLLMKNN